MRLWTIHLLCLAGCASPFMNASAAIPRPPADRAVVVFLRDDAATARYLTILDENGRFLGDAQAGARFAAVVSPGRHVFYSWGTSIEALSAELAPGGTYYVEVDYQSGYEQIVYLLAITHAEDRKKKLESLLKNTEPQAPDLAAGDAHFAARRAAAVNVVMRGHARLAAYTAEQLAQRTLRPEDKF